VAVKGGLRKEDNLVLYIQRRKVVLRESVAYERSADATDATATATDATATTALWAATVGNCSSDGGTFARQLHGAADSDATVQFPQS